MARQAPVEVPAWSYASAARLAFIGQAGWAALVYPRSLLAAGPPRSQPTKRTHEGQLRRTPVTFNQVTRSKSQEGKERRRQREREKAEIDTKRAKGNVRA